MTTNKSNAKAPVRVRTRASHAAVVRSTKSQLVLEFLHRREGVSVAEIMEATGWQAHSVRGFLSAVVRKELGVTLISDVGSVAAHGAALDHSALVKALEVMANHPVAPDA